MFCHHCGAQINGSHKFCPACGQPLPEAPASNGYTAPANVEVRAWYWIGQGWDIVKQDLFTFALMTIVMILLCAIVPFLLNGAFAVGMHIAIMRRMRAGRMEFGDVFKGFNYFLPAMVASLLVAVFSFLGSLACLIPGLVIQAMYFFVHLFIVDRKMDFWPAMQASHEIVKKNYVGFTLMLLAFIPLHLLGVLACIVGILVTVPVQAAAITVAYRDLVGFASPSTD
jgi:uncharacterized membrane protein